MVTGNGNVIAFSSWNVEYLYLDISGYFQFVI